MWKTIRYRSRERKENHIVITANFPDEESVKEFKRNIKKAIRKTERLLNEEFSFEMYLNC